jgi:hypothetical protein
MELYYPAQDSKGWEVVRGKTCREMAAGNKKERNRKKRVGAIDTYK